MTATCTTIWLLAQASPAWELALTVGVFVATALLIVTVFGQPGKIRISPQREAALATGHTDRKTVFESSLLGPLMWLLLAISHRLAMPRLKQWLRRQLVAAGSPSYYTAEEYLAFSLFTGVILAALLEILHFLLLGSFSFAMVMVIVGLVVGMSTAIYQLHSKAAKRIRLISKRVPYSLDLVALAMGAGATFVEAVKTVVREGLDDPFNIELKTVLAEMELGTTRRQSLLNLARRVPLDSLQGIVASVIQAEELGTPLAEVLRSQATLLRLHRSVRAENRAAIASVRMLIPSLLIMMGAVFAVFAPAILRSLRKGLF